jgi:hypothetical protein
MSTAPGESAFPMVCPSKQHALCQLRLSIERESYVEQYFEVTYKAVAKAIA